MHPKSSVLPDVFRGFTKRFLRGVDGRAKPG